jgi:DNA-3-methyladenine glycosylase I
MIKNQKIRCAWVSQDPLYMNYHDTEWGVPQRNDQKLFELLMLEGFQAGLSWITVLKKRENFRKAFDGFQAEIIAAYDDDKVEELMKNQGIIRHRGKIMATIKGAQVFLSFGKGSDSFSHFLWSFVNHQPLINSPASLSDVPTKTDASIAMSKALKQKGFNFCGPTICYAFMQAAGMVNDHTSNCFLSAY